MNLRENTQHTKNSFLQFSQKLRGIFQIRFLHVVGNKKLIFFIYTFFIYFDLWVMAVDFLLKNVCQKNNFHMKQANAIVF